MDAPPANPDPLSDSERRFLIEAFRIEEALRPVASADRLVPVLKWRTVGSFCGLAAGDSDRVTSELAARGWVRVLDDAQHTMLLTRGADWARDALEARRKRARRIRDVILALTTVLLFLLHHRAST